MARPDRPTWNPLQAVAQAIADGEPWILAWTLHSATSYRLLSRGTGIPDHRLDDIYRGAPPGRSELAALARVRKADLDDVMLTLPGETPAQ
ncbi:hypothetical protein [Sphingomonas mali]|uniref:hypothetical protein n=1 Tax=Sphingomonas mali TaxID=40682 RepID=UPI000834DD8F|nr:hypothetical protein [Sphingomonas mali]